MNKKRLTILRDALIEHAKNPGNLRFNLDTWAHAKAKYLCEDFHEVVRKAQIGENFCGTTACAMGLAGAIPEFNRAGLKLVCEAGCWDPKFFYSPEVWFDGLEGFDAAESFFDISREDAIELFNPDNYAGAERKNPLAVADKITALLMTA